MALNSKTIAHLVSLGLVIVLAHPDRLHAASLARVEKIYFSSERNRTRVVVKLSRAAGFEQGEVPEDEEPGMPRRLFLDIGKARLKNPKGSVVQVQDSRLYRIRTGQFDSTTVRVVLDLKPGVDGYKVFSLQNPFRVVIDLFGQPGSEAGPTEQEETGKPMEEDVDDAARAGVEELVARDMDEGGKIEQPEEEHEGTATAVSAPFKRIVIDPGHGGEQCGAIGKSGLEEKDVVLDIAKRLKKMAERAFPGMEVLLTRDSDVTMALEDRTRFANKVSAELFISIHANAHPRRSRYGIETYYLNVTSDRYANRLAQVENRSSGKSLTDLQFILADLTRMANVNESRELARYIQGGLVRKLSRGWDLVKDLGVKSALFYVLLGAKMPACLVEVSFLSNPREEKRLKDPVYRDAIAEGILDGIEAFAAEAKERKASEAAP